MATRYSSFASLFRSPNKAEGETPETQEGVISDFLPEYKDDTPDKDLIKLKKAWEAKYKEYLSTEKIEDKQKEAHDYWLGKHFESLNKPYYDDRSVADNLIFEALETFLPQATRQNPEPFVSGEQDDISREFATLVRDLLADLTDVLKIKLKVKDASRHWALFLIGVGECFWNEKKNRADLKIHRPQKLILDPDGFVAQGEYTGEYIGIYEKKSARDLIDEFGNAELIKAHVKNDEMGTKIQYIRWVTEDKVFWTLGDKVLDKRKNANWNDETLEEVVDELGEVDYEMRAGINHFAHPTFPFAFLTVFSTGKQPHDETSLILQNLSNQDMVNKKVRQIDRNTDKMNGGLLFDQNAGWDTETAAIATRQWNQGKGVLAMKGSVEPIMGASLAPEVYNHLADTRNELKGIFGTLGTTPQGLAGEQTVRGKILRREADQSRIGGGVSEYIEQFVDQIYNILVQIIYVYYQYEDLAMVLGEEKAMRFLELKEQMRLKVLRVSVKEGSLIPKDPLTKRNEASDLFAQGAYRPRQLFEALEKPDPEQAERDLLEWQVIQSNPMGYLQTGQATPPPMVAEEEGLTAEPTPAPALLNQVPI